MTEKNDFDLIQEFHKGKTEAFNEIVRRYQQKVYWIAKRMVGSHEEADDIVQDVFVKVFKNLKNFRCDSSFYTWIYRITTNQAINMLRKKKLVEFVRFDTAFPALSAAGDENLNPLKKLETKENYSLLQEAISALSPKQKKVFLLRYYDELPYEEISKMLKTSVGGLKANYFHALKNIQKYVKKKNEY